MDLNILKDQIKNSKIEKAISTIEEIGKNKYKEAVPLLIDYLGSTDNHIIRNAIAIALSDIGDPRAVEPIVNMLKNPITIGHRGTLLYALEPFNYSDYIELLTEFLIDDNFEVSRQSLSLIESITTDIPSKVIQESITKIESEIEKLRDKINFLTESIKVLNKLKNNNTYNKSYKRK